MTPQTSASRLFHGATNGNGISPKLALSYRLAEAS